VRYVLDTNAVSALIRGEPVITARLERVGRADVGVPQPALAEISYGIERLPPSRRRETLQERLDLVRAELPRVPWTDRVTERFGAIKATLERKGRRTEDFDAAIAAHALAEGATLVTADNDDMARVPGLTVEDWTVPASGR
jgi:tRNA(fMet)-specific endonuclease VapC